MKNNIITIILFLLVFTPLSAIAYKPAPAPKYQCYRMQHSITNIIYETAEMYNKDGIIPKIDIDNPKLDFDKTLDLLVRNNYLKRYLYKVNDEKCKYLFKYCASGTSSLPDYKNIVYCEFHGSEDLGILPLNPKEIEWEYKKFKIRQKIAEIIIRDPELILISFIFIIFIIVMIIFKSGKAKKTNE